MEPAVHLSDSWRLRLQPEFASPYMSDLLEFLEERKARGVEIFPQPSHVFHALNVVALDDVKVVIIGQDPYHGPGQAHGLSFSVQPGVRTPPSLINIYKELESDLGIPPAPTGHLEAWASQGVLLLNSVLTVERGKAASHSKKGWERFTDAVVRLVAEKEEPSVFILWGNYAQEKASRVDERKHLVIRTSHPSPLWRSAHKGFFGSRPFSLTNKFLQEHGRKGIDWRLQHL
ncbi:uracil-DNA glycosylase [Sphingomonas sp. 3-13AW]|uniref:uracil-DNA glycosylase n=1 Tax=Sphingomonas sp. 3-13AW TaxID=3050450 RepID=UPI003BB53FE7